MYKLLVLFPKLKVYFSKYVLLSCSNCDFDALTIIWEKDTFDFDTSLTKLLWNPETPKLPPLVWVPACLVGAHGNTGCPVEHWMKIIHNFYFEDFKYLAT